MAVVREDVPEIIPMGTNDDQVLRSAVYFSNISGQNHVSFGKEAIERGTEIVTRQDGSMLVEASMNIDDFMEEMGILSYEDLESEDFTTLGGLAMFLIGRIPKAGDIFTYKNLQFEVVDMDRGRVDKLLVIKRDEEE